MGISIGSVILQSGVNTLSTAVISGYTIGTKVESIIVSPMAIFGSTIGTYIGQNYGAKNFIRLRKGFWIIFRWELVASIACFAIVQLFGWQICELFINANGEQSVPYAFQYISTISFFFPLLCLVHIYTNSQKGNRERPSFYDRWHIRVNSQNFSFCIFWIKKFGYSAVCLASPCCLGRFYHCDVSLVPLQIAQNGPKEKERTTRELFQSEIIKTGRWSNTSPTGYFIS